MNHRTLSALSLALACVVTTAARAEVLYYQSAANLAGSGASYGGVRTADDFTIFAAAGSQARVNRINTYMLTNQTVDPAKYGLEIYADAGGTPGQLIFSKSGASEVYDQGWSPTTTRTALVVFTNMDIPLAVNTRYWVSVVGLDSALGYSGFATASTRSTSGMVAKYYSSIGGWVDITTRDSSQRDFAFDVSGTITPMVPAPGAAGALGIGALTLARRRRR
jgi:hypothetical protein